jgi:glycosyltransferase involved in cell wall biosynthesis
MVKRNAVAWTIGVLTVPPRATKLRELLNVLEPQVVAAEGKVQLIVFYNNFDKSLGDLRQTIVDTAKGEYISFVDDDDMVPSDFIDAILPHLDGKNDYVGFKVALFNNGHRMKPVYHSLKYPDWYEDDNGYYRDITHLNPIKLSIAQQATFRGGAGEDVGWSNQLRGKAKTEHFIDREMYEYRHSSVDTLSNGPRPGDISRDMDFNHMETIQ